MPPKDKNSTGLPHRSKEGSRSYDSTGSKQTAANARDDPSKPDAVRVKYARENHDRSWDLDDDRPSNSKVSSNSRRDSVSQVTKDRRDPLSQITNNRRDPAPEVDLPDSREEKDLANSDPLDGFSITARQFLNYNVVNIDFLHDSAAYLKGNLKLIREQESSDWRERARRALRMGNAELARKLIQQALILDLSQPPSGIDGLQRYLKHPSAFEDFIKRTYPIFLQYLREAEIAGLLDGRRQEMLQPWAKFVEWTCGEDILQTLSISRTSKSASWKPRDDTGTSTRYSGSTSTPDFSRRSTGNGGPAERQQQTQGYTRQQDPRAVATVGSIPTDSTQRNRSSGVTGAVSGADSRRERTQWAYEDAGTVRQLSTAPTQSRAVPHTQAYGTQPISRSLNTRHASTIKQSDEEDSEEDVPAQRKLRKGKYIEESDEEDEAPDVRPKRSYHDMGTARESSTVIHQPRAPKHPQAHHVEPRANSQSRRSVRTADNSDEDENVRVQRKDYKGKTVEDDDDADDHSEDFVDAIETPTTYEHRKGLPPPDATPRIPNTKHAVKTTQPQKDARRSDIPDRRVGPDPGISRPSQVPNQASAPSQQPANPILRLSGLLIGFVGCRTFQECWEYYDDNPQLSKADLSQFQGVALDCLRQGRRNTAIQVIERWLMLRNAYMATEGPSQYMKWLHLVSKRQDDLQSQCETVLEALEKILRPSASSSSGTTGAEDRQNIRRPSTQSTARQPAEHTKKPTKNLRS